MLWPKNPTAHETYAPFQIPRQIWDELHCFGDKPMKNHDKYLLRDMATVSSVRRRRGSSATICHLAGHDTCVFEERLRFPGLIEEDERGAAKCPETASDQAALREPQAFPTSCI